MGFGQGLFLGAVGTVVGWVHAEAAPGPVAQNVAFVGLAVTWALAFVGAVVAGALTGTRSGARLFGDGGLARASFVMPALGLSVVGPISLQAAIGVVPALMGYDVDGWILFAMAGTLHVHVVFALAMVVEAVHVADDGRHRRVLLWPAVLLSLVPGALLVFPPVLVWCCGFVVSRVFMARAVRWFHDDHAVPA